MASTVSNGNDRSEKWQRPFQMATAVYEREISGGAVVRALPSHQCGPGSIPTLGVICGLSSLVLYSAPRGFSRGTPLFPSLQKPTFDLSEVEVLNLCKNRGREDHDQSKVIKKYL